MKHYNTLIYKLTNSQLNELRSRIKNKIKWYSDNLIFLNKLRT